jgi:hypothetical protein
MSHQKEIGTVLQRETTVSMFKKAYKDLGIAFMLTQCNIVKGCGIGVSAIFSVLLLLVFTGKNLYVAMNARYSIDFEGKKDVYYRFLKDPHFNWSKFILRLSFKVACICCSTFTGTPRPCFLVMDDSIIKKQRSKNVELLSWIHDHVCGKTIKCFNLLMLGWTDGYSFLPVQFLMMCSAKNLAKEASETEWNTDPRTCAGRTKKMAQWQKATAAVEMVRRALETGFEVTALLVDTWFTNEPFIKKMLDIGMDTIGMLKNHNQQYWYKGKLYSLPALFHQARFCQKGDTLGSIIVETKYSRIKVKIVFVVNRNKRSEWISILSSNIDLSDEQIIEYYGNRWSIECCFKVMKGMLGLGKEFQTRSYAATISSTAIVATRYIILEYLHRINTDFRTLNEMCRDLFDEVPRMGFDEALQTLLAVVSGCIREHAGNPVAVSLRSAVVVWYVGLPKKVAEILPLLDFGDEAKADIPIPECEGTTEAA